MRTRVWTFDYLAACHLVGEPVETGDRLSLEWRGELLPPRLAPPHTGRPVIVTRVNRDDTGLAHSIEVALIAEGHPARV